MPPTLDNDLKETLIAEEQKIQDTLHGNNPDILSCIANLSNDEVFTPPSVANDVLDLLPDDIWQNPDATFLDPCAKTGVFLREIVKRLDMGLADMIPDAQQRIDHILQNQVYGIGITELTALMTRRTVYCSKTANGKNSLSPNLKTANGNIKFDNINHKWGKDKKCKYCGASKKQFNRGKDLETHAYQFIHTDNPQELFKMKFDVIVGNPPYQLSDGGGKGASAMPLYHKFIEQAQKLNPRYLSMIVPARWYSGGRGLDDFRKNMLNDNRIRVLVDYPKATDCFGTEGTDFEGGVCYFLWDRDNQGDCLVKSMDDGQVVAEMKRPLKMENSDIFIRDHKAIPILQRIREMNDDTFSEIVSPNDPFGFDVREEGSYKRVKPNYKLTKFKDSADFFYNGWHNLGKGYIAISDIRKNHDWVNKYKMGLDYFELFC